MKQPLINLQSTQYEHRFDREALETVRKLPGFDSVVNFVLNWTMIKWHIVELCGSNFHVTKESCPELYNMVRESAETLDIDRLPEIYTQWSYGINAYTTGYKDDTILVLQSGSVDLMPDPELTFVIGHEMGHIKSGHVLYHMMVKFFAQIISSTVLAGKFIVPIQLGLNYWYRMSEFTADRAGLLVCQDLEAALGAIMKMAGLPKRYFNTSDPHVFAKQAKEFMTKYGDTTDKIIRNISILDDTHPWTVMRAYELIKWVENGEYDKILSGNAGKTCPMCKKAVDIELEVCPVCGYKF